MKKFLVLYRSPITSTEQVAKSTPDQAKAGMDAWMAWAKSAGSAIVDLGMPLGSDTSLAKGGKVSAGSLKVGGFSILQGGSINAVTKLLERHPHFEIPGATIEVLEYLTLPGV